MNAKKILFSLTLLGAMSASAYDFSFTIDGQRLYFDVTSKSKKTASLTFDGTASNRKTYKLKGTIEIPAKIRHNNVLYTVSEIGPKTFAEAKDLKGIVIPSGVERIGDFAFEGCDSLKTIVFPGNPVTFGQGVFFKCYGISSVTLGSDWKNLDLTMFRWSKELSSISIPAKVEKIQGLKKLKTLKEILVDGNNSHFSSYDGVLYSKDGKTLYGCPRAHEGDLRIKEGTEKIESGALIDCQDVTFIDFPSTLQSVSFRETSEMKCLKTILMRSAEPVVTGYLGNEGRFFFVLCDQKTEIVVPNSSKNKYIEKLATDAGQYSPKPGGVQYEILIEQLPTKKRIKGVKNFDKY